MKNNDAMKIT